MSDDKGKGSDRAVDVAGAARRLRCGVEAISQGAEVIRFPAEAFLCIAHAFAHVRELSQDTSAERRLASENEGLRGCLQAQQDIIVGLLAKQAAQTSAPAPYSDKETTLRKRPTCEDPHCRDPEHQSPEEGTNAIPSRADPLRGVAVIDLWGSPGAGWGWS